MNSRLWGLLQSRKSIPSTINLVKNPWQGGCHLERDWRIFIVVCLNWHTTKSPSKYLCLYPQKKAALRINRRSLSSQLWVNAEARVCSRCWELVTDDCSGRNKTFIYVIPTMWKEIWEKDRRSLRAENWGKACKMSSSRHKTGQPWIQHRCMSTLGLYWRRPIYSKALFITAERFATTGFKDRRKHGLQLCNHWWPHQVPVHISNSLGTKIALELEKRILCSIGKDSIL